MPAGGITRVSACRNTGMCPVLGLRTGLRQSMPSTTRVDRTQVVMMAKKKLTEAQRKALEALEAFEAVTGAPTAVDEGPSEEELEKQKKREEKKKKLKAKKQGATEASSEPQSEGDTAKSAPANGKKKPKGMTETQLRALEALEAFEASEPGKSVSEDYSDEEQEANSNKVWYTYSSHSLQLR